MEPSPSPIDRATRRAVLLIILLQSIGIRALPMQGIASGVGICLVMLLNCRISVARTMSFLLPWVAFVGFAARGMTQVNELGYLALVIATGALFVQYTGGRWAEVEEDLLEITWWLGVHGVASYLLFLLVPNSFATAAIGGLDYRVLGPFVLRSFDGARATGLCWEPGLFQYICNLCIFMSLKQGRRGWLTIVPLAGVVFSHSTTGIFCLVPSFVYVLSGVRWSARQVGIALGAVVLAVVLVVTVFRPNLEQKLSGSDTSALVRLRDLKVGWDLLSDKPLVGHGQFDEVYLTARSELYRVTDDLFSSEFLADNSELAGGYTSGFMAIFAGFGVLLGGFLYWCFWSNQVIGGRGRERLGIFVISLVTFISEPITNTSWFYLFVVSGLVTLFKQPDEVVPECP